jgi:two-component system sensor histidine kinase VicK
MTNLKELVDEVLMLVKTQADAKKRNILEKIGDDLPQISIDPLLVRQVYLNLITNAVKYTPEGGNIEISLHANDSEIISEIKDSGFGIPEKEKERVFDRFFRAANAVSREIKGNGLGLYLTKAVVEISGGKIWFDTAEDRGTTFYFTLPLAGTTPKEGVVTFDA